MFIRIVSFPIWIVLLCFTRVSVLGEASTEGLVKPRSVLLIAGESSHGWNEHEYPKGGELLVDCINQSGLAVEATLSVGWPTNDRLFEQHWDCVVLYSDGVEQHVAVKHVDTLNQMLLKGTGFAVLHFALEPPTPDDALAAFLEKSVGGYFKVGLSVNPIWQLKEPTLTDHEITQGVGEFELEDEWYYHLYFPSPDRITPILSALPPADSLGSDGPRSGNDSIRMALENGEAQILSWVAENEHGGRGFAFTGGHYLHNWNHDDFRKLVINGIVWTAGVLLPSNGVDSAIEPIVTYKSINEAIARGDIDDIARHIRVNPSVVNKAGRGQYTPLHVAVLRNNLSAVELLIEYKADPNLLTSADENVLHLAVKRGTSVMVETLMKAGANPSQRDRVGWTPLHHAAAKSKTEIAKVLIAMGADVNFRSAAGGTALHEAAASGSAEMIELLLQAGVEKSLKSNDGKTALDIAIEFGNQEAINLL